jgi:L,D-peptidoglycan transpeptidase YkuD (ErfK/YbiS/YcfS/YnhG family)
MDRIMHLILTWVVLSTVPVTALPACAREEKQSTNIRIPRPLVHIDPADKGEQAVMNAILVDKSRQRMVLYRYDSHWQEITQWPCSTGKQSGQKRAEGDGKTPEGVYFATRNVTQPYLSPRYGSRALPLDYPSWIDRYRRRGGSAIWLHGTNSPLIANNSNGCVVLTNDHIDQVAQYVNLYRTPIIIVGRLTWWTEQKARITAQKILTAVDHWHQALMQGSYADFSHWYRIESRPDMKWWQQWCHQRKFRSSQMKRPDGVIRQRALFRSSDAFVMTFDHFLQISSQQVRVGTRKLFLKLEKGHVRIIGDMYQRSKGRKQDALFAAWQKLQKKVKRQSEIADFRIREKTSSQF